VERGGKKCHNSLNSYVEIFIFLKIQALLKKKIPLDQLPTCTEATRALLMIPKPWMERKIRTKMTLMTAAAIIQVTSENGGQHQLLSTLFASHAV
jgi:hypothetical protein